MNIRDALQALELEMRNPDLPLSSDRVAEWADRVAAILSSAQAEGALQSSHDTAMDVLRQIADRKAAHDGAAAGQFMRHLS